MSEPTSELRITVEELDGVTIRVAGEIDYETSGSLASRGRRCPRHRRRRERGLRPRRGRLHGQLRARRPDRGREPRRLGAGTRGLSRGRAHHPGDRSAAPPGVGAVNHSRVFAARPDSIRQARTFVEAALAGIELPALQSIVLMVSELATNSVRHAGSEFTVDISSAGDAVRVVITDRGSGRAADARTLARRAHRPRSADRRPPGRRMGHRRRLGRDLGVVRRAGRTRNGATIRSSRTSAPLGRLIRRRRSPASALVTSSATAAISRSPPDRSWARDRQAGATGDRRARPVGGGGAGRAGADRRGQGAPGAGAARAAGRRGGVTATRWWMRCGVMLRPSPR